MTSSIKPEAHNVSQRRRRQNEPRLCITCTKIGKDRTCLSHTHTHARTHAHTHNTRRRRRRRTESSRSTDPHVIGATCDGQTDQCARHMVCRRCRKSTSSSLLQQHGPSWPSGWRQELLCASPRKPIWHLSSTVSRHSCQWVQSATRKEPDRTLVG